MQALAAISLGLAGTAFCVMHLVKCVLKYRAGKDKDEKIDKVRKELTDEILNGGNVARIYALRQRLQKLLAD